MDRTFSCTPSTLFAGLRDLDVDSSPLYKDPTVTTPAHLVIRSGTENTAGQLVTVRARSWRYLGNAYPGGVFASSRRCVQTAAKPPLAQKGLPEPPTVWFKSVECQVRGKVLVRVRAVLASAVQWRRQDATLMGARTSVVSAKVALREQRSGEPVADAELDGDKTRLWFSPGCSSG